MRLLFFILLLVNVTALAYFVYRDQQGVVGRQSAPQINAQQIRIRNETGPGTDTLVSSCWVWRGLSADDIRKVQGELDTLVLGDKLAQLQPQEYWLHMPPLKNKTEAEKKLAELAGLGIDDAVLLDESGKWRYAISFKAYPTEDEALVHLNQLKEKGVKSAKIVQRDAPADGFTINQADEKISAVLRQMHAAYPNSTLTQADCAPP